MWASATRAPAVAAREASSSRDSRTEEGAPRPGDLSRVVRCRPARMTISSNARAILCGAISGGVSRVARPQLLLSPTGEPGAACAEAVAAGAGACGPLWKGFENTTVEIACLKINCSRLLDSRITEYLSKLLIRPDSLTPLIR